MTWDELCTYLRTTQEVTEDGARALNFWWKGVGTRAIGPQKLRIAYGEVADLRCVIVMTLLGSDLELSQAEALHISGTLTFGALMLKDRRYLLRVSTLLDHLTLAELESIFGYTAATGADLRERAGNNAIDADLFGWTQD
jgi:hypothetical protein